MKLAFGFSNKLLCTTLLLSVLAIPAAASNLTEEQIQLSINTQIAFMQRDGELAALSKCSGKKEDKIIEVFKSKLASCFRGDQSLYSACYQKSLLSSLGMSKVQVMACDTDNGEDAAERLSELLEQEDALLQQIEELNNKDELSEADNMKLDELNDKYSALQQEIIKVQDADSQQALSDLEIVNHEMAKINKTLSPIESHEFHSSEPQRDEPWYERAPAFSHLSKAEREAKQKQWRVCSFMSKSSTIVSETIGLVKRQPDAFAVTDEQNQAQMRSMHPANHGTFLDVIDDKIMAISLENWAVAHTPSGTHKIALQAWQWCQGQPVASFVNLKDSRF